jgi:hypothetical protein
VERRLKESRPVFKIGKRMRADEAIVVVERAVAGPRDSAGELLAHLGRELLSVFGKQRKLGTRKHPTGNCQLVISVRRHEPCPT